MDWDAFKMKTANLTTANPMLMMQRRNVNWVIKPKNQVRKTWGVTHVLLIMEEVLLSKVLNIMEKLVEVWGGGGGWSILIVTIKFSWSFHNVPNYSIDLPHWPPIFFIPTFKLCQRRLIPSPFPLKTMISPPPQDSATPPKPSFQVKNGDLFLTSDHD